LDGERKPSLLRKFKEKKGDRDQNIPTTGRKKSMGRYSRKKKGSDHRTDRRPGPQQSQRE